MLHRIAHEDERIRRAGILGAVVLARYREASAQCDSGSLPARPEPVRTGDRTIPSNFPSRMTAFVVPQDEVDKTIPFEFSQEAGLIRPSSKPTQLAGRL